jgi:peptide/nickel transport system permease protein
VGPYVLRRLAAVIPMLIGISVILFTIMNLAPGGPEAVLLGTDLSPEAAQQLRSQMGLDKPLPVQYVRWAAAAAQGDLGYSYKSGRPVAQEINERLGATLELTVASLLVAVVLAVPVGVVAATRPYSLLDNVTTVGALIGVSFPSFWLGIMLIMLFSGSLHWLPASGLADYGLEGDWANRLSHAVLPTLTLASTQMATLARFTRSSVLDTLKLDYIRTARAKGLREWRVVLLHAVRNGLIPVVTVIGLSMRFVVGGAVLTETIFAWPGLGRLAVQAVTDRDYPVIMGINLLIAVVVICANLVTDLTYAAIDPRIRYE